MSVATLFSITISALEFAKMVGIAQACWTPSMLKYGPSDRAQTKPADPGQKIASAGTKTRKWLQEGRQDHCSHCVLPAHAKAGLIQMLTATCGPISPLHISLREGVKAIHCGAR